MSFYIAFLGAPGSGKGTQSKLLSDILNIEEVSVGDWIRDEIRNKTELGILAAKYANDGKLVPDSVIIDMYAKRTEGELSSKGFISDGFPRTVEQAKSFDSLFSKKPLPIKILHLDVSLDSIKERLLGRRSCSSCKAIYHITYKPSSREGVCDVCGAALEQRIDDNEEAITQRFQEYQNKSKPMINYFADRVIKIDGNETTGFIQAQIKKKLAL